MDDDEEAFCLVMMAYLSTWRDEDKATEVEEKCFSLPSS
jgi:hypothetical protein